MFKKFLAIGLILGSLALVAGCVVHPLPYHHHRGYYSHQRSHYYHPNRTNVYYTPGYSHIVVTQ